MPMNSPVEDPAPSADEWIARIYALAADPGRLLALRPALEQLADHGLVTGMHGIAYHFAQAEALVDDQPLRHAARDGADPAPVTRLDRRLAVESAGLFAAAPGAVIGEDAWLPSREALDRQTLKAVLRGDLAHAFVQLRADPAAARPTTFLVLPRREDERVAGLDLHPIALRWEASSAADFAEDFSLSEAEAAVLRETLERGDLRALAGERGTSLGTVRNQRKALMAKLDVSSQNELIALYAGYRELRRLRPREASRRVAPKRLEIDGVEIGVRMHGPDTGRPVLYFHPLFGGTRLPPALEAACHAHGLRLVAPARPYCDRQADEGSGLSMVRAFADRSARLLDRLGLASLPVLAASGGTPYALAFAQAHPHKCERVLVAGPTVPIASGEDLRAIGLGQRLPLQLARALPTAMRLYVKAALSVLARRLEDRDYLLSFYRESPADRAYVADPAHFAFLRDALEEQFASGTRCGVEELLLNAQDWSALARDIEVPVTLVAGEDDRLAPRPLLERFAAHHGFGLDAPLPDAGSFVLFQRSADIIARLAAPAG